MRVNSVILFPGAVLFTLFSASIIYPQISWGINTETGYNFASGSGIVTKSDFLLGLDGELEYNFEKENRGASFLIRAKPELYGLRNNVFSAKLKAGGSYYQKKENFNWGIKLTRQHNIYKGNNLNLNYNIFLLNAEASCFFIDNTPFTLDLGYAYQTTKDRFEQNLDLLFLDAKFFTRLDYLKIGYGVYIERFKILYEQWGQFAFKDSNAGWRIGPQISLIYLRNWIFRAEYRFLIHDSPVTKFPSYDQWIRLLAGKFIFNDLSFFILVDFYSRDYNLINDTSDIQPLIYFPIDQENNFYFKVEYDLSDTCSVYIRTGYFTERFVVNDLSFSGWNVLMGVGVGN